MAEQTQTEIQHMKRYSLSLKRASKSMERTTTKKNQYVVGSPHPINQFELKGYLHKTRLHKTDLKLKDFDFLKYHFDAGGGYHYFLGEACINKGRKTEQVLNKILICKLK